MDISKEDLRCFIKWGETYAGEKVTSARDDLLLKVLKQHNKAFSK